MPRKLEIPEYNKPEQDYVRNHFSPQRIGARRRKLCDRSSVGGCRLLPLTIKGEDCPYFTPKPEEAK